jgi:hypothetical protein
MLNSDQAAAFPPRSLPVLIAALHRLPLQHRGHAERTHELVRLGRLPGFLDAGRSFWSLRQFCHLFEFGVQEVMTVFEVWSVHAALLSARCGVRAKKQSPAAQPTTADQRGSLSPLAFRGASRLELSQPILNRPLLPPHRPRPPAPPTSADKPRRPTSKAVQHRKPPLKPRFTR